MVVFIRREMLRSELLFSRLAVFVQSLIVHVHLLFGSALRLVLQVEAERLLEVHLDGSALVLAFERIIDLHVNLRSIESSITVIEGPGHSKFIKSLLEGPLSLIPLFVSAKSIFGASRQLQLKGESKDAVDVLQEV